MAKKEKAAPVAEKKPAVKTRAKKALKFFDEAIEKAEDVDLGQVEIKNPEGETLITIDLSQEANLAELNKERARWKLTDAFIEYIQSCVANGQDIDINKATHTILKINQK